MSYGIKKPISVLSNGIDTDFFAFRKQYRDAFRKKYQLGDNDKAVLSVGHYIARKGILDFINLARSMPETRFFWFGYTNLNLVQKKLADRESDRRKREQYYAALSGWNRREALAAADPLALEAGEVSDT